MLNINDYGMPFTSEDGDRKYSALEWREYFSRLIHNGLIQNAANECQVKPQAAPNKTVYVDTGVVFINGAMRILEEPVTLPVAENTSGNPRIDRVVARLNEASRTIEFDVLEGTPAGAPVAPDLTRTEGVYELGLADITLANGYGTITSGVINDKRWDVSLCGASSMTIGVIPPSGLDAVTVQLETETADLFNLIGPDRNVDKALNVLYRTPDIFMTDVTQRVFLDEVDYTVCVISKGALGKAGGLCEFDFKPVSSGYFDITVNGSLISFSNLCSITHATTSANGVVTCSVVGANKQNGVGLNLSGSLYFPTKNGGTGAGTGINLGDTLNRLISKYYINSLSYLGGIIAKLLINGTGGAAKVGSSGNGLGNPGGEGGAKSGGAGGGGSGGTYGTSTSQAGTAGTEEGGGTGGAGANGGGAGGSGAGGYGGGATAGANGSNGALNKGGDGGPGACVIAIWRKNLIAKL